MQNFTKEKQKYLNLGPKMPDFGILGLEFEWKQYCHIWNQHPQICLIAKFCEKKSKLNLRPKMPYMGYFGLEF